MIDSVLAGWLIPEFFRTAGQLGSSWLLAPGRCPDLSCPAVNCPRVECPTLSCAAVDCHCPAVPACPALPSLPNCTNQCEGRGSPAVCEVGWTLQLLLTFGVLLFCGGFLCERPNCIAS